jgi:hypothetical protein
LEIGDANFGNHVVDLTHVNNEFSLDSLSVVNAEFAQELVGHRDKRLFGPGQEPIDIALGQEGGELLRTETELRTNGGEGKNGMEAILHTVDEIDPHFEHGRIFTLNTSFLHVDSLLLKRNQVTIFFGMEAGNFTSGKHRVDHLKESLALDLSISEQESDGFTTGTSLIVKLLDVILELDVTIGLGERDLEEILLANERGKLGERLLTRTTNTDQEAIA